MVDFGLIIFFNSFFPFSIIFWFYRQERLCSRGGQINDFSRTAPPYLGTYWSKSPGNFSSASTIDAFRDSRKKKNISAQQNAAMRTRTLFKTQYVYLVLLVQSWHVIPFSPCTESQESKYDVRSHNQTRQCTLKGGKANFSSSDFKRDFLHQYLLKS